MTFILVLIALLIAAISTLFVSQATMGVWAMAGAVLLAALARIAQASLQHKEILALIHKETEPATIITEPIPSQHL